MSAEAAITAIICMQPYVHGTAENALSRLSGTIIGAIWGFLFLLVMMLFPWLGHNRPILYLLMGLGTLISLHSAVLLRKPDASGLAAIVFVCVVIAYPDIENPLDQAFHRILEVLVGTVIAVGVNAVRLPRVKLHNKVFFVPMLYLTTNQFARLSPPVVFRLQNLLLEGAKICLMSRHAPAFQTAQLGHVQFSVPMIVMDGAAIFDPNENEYIATTNINSASCRWLMKRLETMGVSYFIYTVHRDRSCIYHHGPMTERERIVYMNLKRSPYRYYLDDDRFSVSDVVYLKLVLDGEDADRIQRELEPMLDKMRLRSIVRPQVGLDDGCSLYFYAANADMRHAQEHLMRMLQQGNPDLEMHDVSAEKPYQVDQDAIRLLRKLKREYEPDIFSYWLHK
ncbi:MAG: FUSC family protein, partial [bacterium]